MRKVLTQNFVPYADKQTCQTHKDNPLFEPSTRFNLESMEPHVRLMLQDSDTVDGRLMILGGPPKKHGAAKISQELPDSWKCTTDEIRELNSKESHKLCLPLTGKPV